MPRRKDRAPSPPKEMFSYRVAHLVGKPTVLGWHVLDLVDVDDQWWRCTRCHAITPEWAVREGWWPSFLGPWCPDFLRAIR